MIPVIDDWVLIVDDDNYSIARLVGHKKDKRGKEIPVYANRKYYGNLRAALNGLREQMERKELGKNHEGLVEAFKAVIKTNERLAEEFDRIKDMLEEW